MHLLRASHGSFSRKTLEIESWKRHDRCRMRLRPFLEKRRGGIVSSRLFWAFGLAALLSFQAHRDDAKAQPVCINPATCGSGYGGQPGEPRGFAPQNVPGSPYAPASRRGFGGQQLGGGSNPYGAAGSNPYARPSTPHVQRRVWIPKLPHIKRERDW
jgi:hypothetical protein